MRTALVVGLAMVALSPAAALAQDAASGAASETRVGGGVYLYHYLPVSLEGVDDRSEIYAAFLDVEHETGPWSFYAETRWRDTRLRDFYPSTTWIQEAWAAYETPLGGTAGENSAEKTQRRFSAASPARSAALTLRAGKIYTRLGRFWDGSFFGNVHYFDGLKLDPDFGAEALLELPVGAATVEARGQYLSDDDRINGALVGRDLEAISSGNESASPLAALHLEAPLLGPRDAGGEDRLRVRAGVSGMLERGTVGVDAGAGPDQPLNELGLDHLAVDVEIYARGHRAYAEYTNRSGSGVPSTAAAGPAGSSAEYWLLGLQLHFPPLHLRYNYSRADYRAAGFRERIHQPGVTLDLQGWLHALVEYDDWTRNRSGADPLRLDRSLNLVLLVDL